MKSFSNFLEQMGGLHDAVVRELVWRPDEEVLRVEFEDICANFSGLPEYPGVTPGHIEFRGVSAARFEVETSRESLKVDEILTAPPTIPSPRAEIRFWPAGRIVIEFSEVEFRDVTIRD